MAKRTLATRQKLVFRGPGKGPAQGPRNPLVVPALLRKAGAHGKTAGAQRQEAKRAAAGQLKKWLTLPPDDSE